MKTFRGDPSKQKLKAGIGEHSKKLKLGGQPGENKILKVSFMGFLNPSF